MVDRVKMEAQLVLHEGLRTRAYEDTEGNVTIGVGYNVTARGLDFLQRTIGRRLWEPLEINETEALLVLRADIDRVEQAVRAHLPEYDQLDEVRQRVCCDIAFNIGYGAVHFEKTIAAVKKRDWSKAAMEMHRSRWCGQVKTRCERLAKMMLTGSDYQE